MVFLYFVNLLYSVIRIRYFAILFFHLWLHENKLIKHYTIPVNLFLVIVSFGKLFHTETEAKL